MLRRPRLETLESRTVPTVTAVGAEFRANVTLTTNAQTGSAVAMDSAGNFVVAFDSFHDGIDYGLYVQRYNSAGATVGTQIKANVYGTNDQRSPAIAMDSDGDFVVAWESFGQDGSGYGVYARRFDRVSGTFGAEFRVNTTTADSQYRPTIGMSATGAFVIAWESFGQTDDADAAIYMQRYDATGVAIGSETRVNVTTTQYQTNPTVSMDNTGDFVVAWESYLTDGSGNGIYARAFNSAGVAVTGEFRVNQYTTGHQQEPSVSLDADGDFVVAWESYGQDGSRFGVYGRRYNAAGVAQGSEFRISTTTSLDQRSPSVSLDATGDFVVAWSSLQESSTYGIYGQRYVAGGAADGGEFKINTYTTGKQWHPAVSSDTAGNFVTVWQSEGQDGSLTGIFGQRYLATVVVPPKVVTTVINAGAAQRSNVTEVAVTFDKPVTLPTNVADAFTLVGPNGSIALTGTVTTNSPGTTVRLTFSGAGTIFGSLLDGLYTLTAVASQITVSGTPLDGNGDGTGGDNYTTTVPRLFGDINGDRTVTSSDFLAFRLAFLESSGSPNFVPGFDGNGDGVIDAADLLAFRLNFLKTV
ncbi:MAG: hypothetical protein K1X57_17745 [Gemmataceae bacterium]|nr:hypothetical protein [Gemmataceae bacterium]